MKWLSVGSESFAPPTSLPLALPPAPHPGHDAEGPAEGGDSSTSSSGEETSDDGENTDSSSSDKTHENSPLEDTSLDFAHLQECYEALHGGARGTEEGVG